MSLTTIQFATVFAEELTAQGVELGDEPAFIAAFAAMLTGWLGGEDALPADLAYRLMQTIGAVNQDAAQRLDWWTGSAVGGPNGDGLYPMTNAAGVVTLFPSLAKILQVTAKGDPGGISYVFGAATAEADPGPGKLRFNSAAAATVTKAWFDTASAAGGDLSGWLASFGFSSSAVKGLLTVQAGATSSPLVYRVTAAPEAKAGYYEVPLAHVSGVALPADAASLTITFTPTGDHGDSVRSGVGAPGAGLGANGDIYLRLDTGLWYGPKAAGAWGGPVAQPEVASLLAQAVAARDVTVAAEAVAVGAAGVAEGAAELAIDARDVATDKAQEASDDRQAVADDKAAMATWLAAFATDKDAVRDWLDQLALDQPVIVAAAATAIAKAGEAAASAASVDGPLIASRLLRLEHDAWFNS